MRRLLLAALALLAATCAQSPIPAFAQEVVTMTSKYRTTQIDSISRRILASAWSEMDSTQNERGYCADVLSDSTGPMVTYGVLRVRPAVMHGATPNSSGFDCPDGTVTLHTHPPATCNIGPNGTMQCVSGGTGAWECYPSFADILLVWKRRDPLGLIQCDRHAIVAFYPSAQFIPNRTQSQGQ